MDRDAGSRSAASRAAGERIRARSAGSSLQTDFRSADAAHCLSSSGRSAEVTHARICWPHCLVVKDPARTAALCHGLFGARAVTREDEDGHVETFVKLAGTWIVLIGAAVERVRTGDLIAFHTTPQALEATAAKRRAMGREVLRARCGKSPYFFDDANHLFELDTEDIDTELVGAQR